MMGEPLTTPVVSPREGISVIVPVHNGESSIQQCLQSILDQRVSCELEVLVVDDASCDTTAARVEALADPRIRIVRLAQNQGISAARNRGVAEARHHWLAFNDHDDIWLPDKLAPQIELLDHVPDAGGCGGGNGRLAADGKSRWSARILGRPVWTPEAVPNLAAPPYYRPVLDGHIYLQSLLVRKDLAAQVPFNPALPLWEDFDFIIRLGRITQLACVQRPVFLYCLGFANTTAPGRMDPRVFLACRAYIDKLASAEHADTQPDARDFLATYEPAEREVEEFRATEAMRRVNTVWVSRGLPSACLEFSRALCGRPLATASYVLSRLRR